jgi:hypothetical protein
MKGGTISGNTAYNGGGVELTTGGTFTMEGGVISGNAAGDGGEGGGVYVSSGGNFTKTGGIIYGAYSTGTIPEDPALQNTASVGPAVFVAPLGGKVRNTTAGEEVNLDAATGANWE